MDSSKQHVQYVVMLLNKRKMDLKTFSNYCNLRKEAFLKGSVHFSIFPFIQNQIVM